MARTAGEEVATGASVASVEAAIYPEPEEEEAGEAVVAGTRGDPFIRDSEPGLVAETTKTEAIETEAFDQVKVPPALLFIRATTTPSSYISILRQRPSCCLPRIH